MRMIFFLCFLSFFAGCLSEKEEVYVLYAGSLTQTTEALGREFEREIGISYRGEGFGSITCARLIKEKLREPDVFLSADFSVIDSEISDWFLTFTSGEMVIAYSPKSKFSEEFSKKIWFEVLQNDDFRLGRTDPDLDPKGYRVLFVVKLAEIFYDKELFEKILGEERNPNQIFRETELLARLDVGQLDAVFAYKHEALERNLPFIQLPKEINLASFEHSDFYKEVSYSLKGKTIYASPITYVLTIPKTAKNKKNALKFVKFVLEKKNLFFSNFGEIPILSGGDKNSIPLELREYVVGDCCAI
ncbi:MAG: extracellular solute-binding protein [Candidatus Methanofastidiosia archaeon]